MIPLPMRRSATEIAANAVKQDWESQGYTVEVQWVGPYAVALTAMDGMVFHGSITIAVTGRLK